MELDPTIIGVAGGFVAGGLAVFTATRGAAREARVLRSELQRREAQASQLHEQIAQLQSARAQLQTALEYEQRAAGEKLEVVEQARQQLVQSFKALSGDALSQNNKQFLDLAQAALSKFQAQAAGDLARREQAIGSMVKPITEQLGKFDKAIAELEKQRVGAYSSIENQIRTMRETEVQLRRETSTLVKALRAPASRGRWGEIHLRKVAEMAGMMQHCDFHEQQSVDSDAGGRQRPDMVVHLPGERMVIVDAKTPLVAFLDSLETEDENERTQFLQQHARHVREHVRQLAAKAYWERGFETPEFVILYLPGEHFLSAALEQDPELVEFAFRSNVHIATPVNLISILRSVAYSWRQERIVDNAREISGLGKTLYERIGVVAGHWADVGKQLGRSVASYNKATASLESRMLVAARKFNELDCGSGSELEPIAAIEVTPTSPQQPELIPEPLARLEAELAAG